MHDHLAAPPVVIVTGGSRGIGLAISKLFSASGYNVIAGSRTLDPKFPSNNKHLIHFPMDVCSKEHHINICKHALELYGRVDCYINNAGFSEWRKLSAIDEIFLDTIIATNLKSVFWGSQAFASLGNSGSIINISSIAGKRGSSNNSAYCATKFAMNGVTQSLAKELGSSDVRVNAICPVLIETPGLISAFKGADSPASLSDFSFIENFTLQNSALGRLPSEVDVAHLALFLASDASSSITGQCINLDCGVFPQ